MLFIKDELGREIAIKREHLILIEPDIKGYYAVHTTVKKFLVKANSLNELIDEMINSAIPIENVVTQTTVEV